MANAIPASSTPTNVMQGARHVAGWKWAGAIKGGVPPCYLVRFITLVKGVSIR